jgi:hypothetical protein
MEREVRVVIMVGPCDDRDVGAGVAAAVENKAANA